MNLINIIYQLIIIKIIHKLHILNKRHHNSKEDFFIKKYFSFCDLCLGKIRVGKGKEKRVGQKKREGNYWIDWKV